MTSQPDIRSLIEDIESVLPDTQAAQRQVLEKLRSYLVRQQQQSETPTEPDQAHAEAIARAVVAQMGDFRHEVAQPLQTELSVLRQQRDAMLKDIRRLEARQQQVTADFLRSLTSNCVETLTKQMSQTLEKIEAQFLDRRSGDTPLTAKQRQSLEQLQQLQRQSDQLLVSLDSTFRAVFQTLEQDLYAYQESLTNGLDHLHSIGKRGETLASVLVERISGQLAGDSTVTPQEVTEGSRSEEVVSPSPEEVREETGEPRNAEPPAQDASSEVVRQAYEASASPESQSTEVPQESGDVEEEVYFPDDTSLYPFAGTEIYTESSDTEEEEQGTQKSPMNNLLEVNFRQKIPETPLPTVEEILFDSEKAIRSSIAEEEEEDSPLTPEIVAEEEEEAETPFDMEEELFSDSPAEELISSGVEIETTDFSPEEGEEPEEILFGETSQEEDGDAVDTIASLSDVLEQTSIGIDEVSSSEDIDEEEFATAEDAFLHASPDENLLPTEASETGDEQDLQGILDDPNKLRQLDEDLERFEEGKAEEESGVSSAGEIVEAEEATSQEVLSPGVEEEDTTSREILAPQMEEQEVLAPEIEEEDAASREILAPQMEEQEVLAPEIEEEDAASPEILASQVEEQEVLAPEIEEEDAASPEILAPQMEEREDTTSQEALPPEAVMQKIEEITTQPLLSSATPDVEAEITAPETATGESEVEETPEETEEQEPQSPTLETEEVAEVTPRETQSRRKITSEEFLASLNIDFEERDKESEQSRTVAPGEDNGAEESRSLSSLWKEEQKSFSEGEENLPEGFEEISSEDMFFSYNDEEEEDFDYTLEEDDIDYPEPIAPPEEEISKPETSSSKPNRDYRNPASEEIFTPSDELPDELLGEDLEKFLIERLSQDEEFSPERQIDRIRGFSQEYIVTDEDFNHNFWEEALENLPPETREKLEKDEKIDDEPPQEEP